MVGIQKWVLVCLLGIIPMLFQITPAYSFNAEFGVSPDNNQALLFSILRGARESLKINIYEFANPTIADELINKIQEGVCTQLLIEGDPVGGISSESVALIEKLITAIQTAEATPRSGESALAGKKRSREALEGKLCSQLRIMPPQRSLAPGKKRRFRYNHAKYVVADQAWSLVSSENFSMNGHPNAGQKGTRGWDIAIEDPQFAQDLTRLFEQDSDLSPGDVQIVDRNLLTRMKEKWSNPKPEASPAPAQASTLPSEPTPGEFPDLSVTPKVETSPSASASSSTSSAAPVAREADSRRRIAARPIGNGMVEKASLITSPHSTGELRKVVETAQRRLDLNFMSLPKDSYIINTLIDGAKRGVATRLLLNDSKAFGHGGGNRPRRPLSPATGAQAQPPRPEKPDAQVETVKFALRLAHCDRLPLDARIVDVRATEITYIHNKGMIVDENKALVSSINGTQNSMDNNREVAVFVESSDAARYYSEFFDLDWARSPTLDISDDLARNPCISAATEPPAPSRIGIFGLFFGMLGSGTQ